MRGQGTPSKLTGVPGWETEDELDLLATLAANADHPDGVILEIGGEFGMSTSIFSKMAPQAHVYTIDTRYDGEIGEINKANLAEAGVGQNVVHLALDSHQKTSIARFKKLEKRGEIHLLFVDGDHSTDGALADLTLWTPLVKSGGFLAVHDCATIANRLPHFLHFEVTKAVAMWFAANGIEWKIAHQVNTLEVFQKE